MEEHWNNVELTSFSRTKSYTPNHEYDSVAAKNSSNNNSDGTINDETRSDPQTEQIGILKPGSKIKPEIKVEIAEALVRRLYGITVSSIKECISYDDRNFIITEDPDMKNPLIVPHWPHGYVFKILNTLDSKKIDFVEAQNELMIYLAKQNVQCPKPILNVNGKYFSVENINGDDHVVRLLQYLPGKIFHEVPMTNYLLYNSGEFLATFDRAAKNFRNEAYETHQNTWMLQSMPNLKNFLFVLQDHSRKVLVEEIIDAFESNVLNKLDTFESQIIHGDYNEQNIIVNLKSGTQNDEYKIAGVIDFGDTSKSPIIFEVGIALTYLLLQAKSLESGGIFLAGYNSIRPIAASEKQYIKFCVVARLAQSLVMGMYTYSQDETNEYVLATQEYGWKLIEELWREQFSKIDDIWQTSADKYLTQSIK